MARIQKYSLLLFSLGLARAQKAHAQFGVENINTNIQNRELIPFIFQLLNTLLGFLALIVFFIMLIAGFQWMMAGGDDTKVATAKARIKNAVIGLIIIFLSWAAVNFIFSILQGENGA